MHTATLGPIASPDVSPLLTHFHRWRIEEQSGARSVGRCSCGEEKSFINGWDGDGFHLGSGSWHNRGPRGGGRAK